MHAGETRTDAGWRLGSPHLAPLYQEIRELPLGSISKAQLEIRTRLSRQATVYHGLTVNLSIRRYPKDVGVDVVRRDGDVEVVVVK